MQGKSITTVAIALVFIIGGAFVFITKVFSNAILNGALAGALIAAGASMLIRKPSA